MPATPPTRRRRIVLIVLAVAIAAAGLGWWAGSTVRSPAQVAADASAPPRSVITAEVESRVLDDTVVTRGTVAPGTSEDIQLRASTSGTGDPVVTAIRKQVGDSIRRGDVIAEIAGRPVIAIPGTIPVYRDLTPGMTGKDVAQLQRALVKLGYSTPTDGTFGSATRTAVSRLYADRGYDPIEVTPTNGPSVDDANQAVLAATRTVQDLQDLPGSGAGGKRTVAEKRTLARAKEDLATAKTALATAKQDSGASVPASEIVTLKSFPALIRATSLTLGGAVTDAAFTVSTGDLRVSAEVNAGSAGLVHTGLAVRLTNEASGEQVDGHVTAVADGTTLTIEPDTPLAASWNGLDIRVTVVSATSGKAVLVVPVAAITADTSRQDRVTVYAGENDTRVVPVIAGVSGAGFVQVTPLDAEALSAGDRVVVGVNGETTASAAPDPGASPATSGPGSSDASATSDPAATSESGAGR